MAAETVLTVMEKKGAVAMLSTHLAFLANSNTGVKEFVKNMGLCISIDVKSSQHFFKIFYPGLQISGEIVREVFPGIFFSNDNLYWDTDFIVAAVGGYKISRLPPFDTSKITILSNPKYNPHAEYPKNTIEYRETNQCHPDFFIRFEKFHRFNDLKAISGPLFPNIGSMKLVTDIVDYETRGKTLFYSQKSMFKVLYPESDLSQKMEEFSKRFANKDENWAQVYDEYKIFLIANLHEYPKLNPSFLFFIKDKGIYNKKIEGLITTKSFESVDSTIESIGNIILTSKTNVYENYKRFNVLGIGEKNGLFFKLKEFFSNGV